MLVLAALDPFIDPHFLIPTINARIIEEVNYFTCYVHNVRAVMQ